MPNLAVDLTNEELEAEIQRLRAAGFTRAVSKAPPKKKVKEDPLKKMMELAERLKEMEGEE